MMSNNNLADHDNDDFQKYQMKRVLTKVSELKSVDEDQSLKQSTPSKNANEGSEMRMGSTNEFF